MLKNKGKRGKNRKRGKNEADSEKRELVFKEDSQGYVQVLRTLGNYYCEGMCINKMKRFYHIVGKMRKKVWITAGDIILIRLRNYQEDKFLSIVSQFDSFAECNFKSCLVSQINFYKSVSVSKMFWRCRVFFGCSSMRFTIKCHGSRHIRSLGSSSLSPSRSRERQRRRLKDPSGVPVGSPLWQYFALQTMQTSFIVRWFP